MDYSELVAAYQELESTQATLEKTSILAELFAGSGEDLEKVVLLSIGRIFPAWRGYQIGISSQMMVDIISQATGRGEKEIEEAWKEKGDLGDAAAEMVENKRQQRLSDRDLTVEDVLERIRKVAEMEAPGMSQSVDQDKKKKQVAELISSAEPGEAKYVTRTVLETLRLGVGEGTVRDALSEAFLEGDHTEEVQRAYDLTNDFTRVAEACREGLEEVGELDIELFRPVKSMLAKKVETVEEGFEEVGKPAAVDTKFDGMRAQIHVKQDEVRVFTRRLEDVTEQFPDVAEAVRQNVDAEEAILDAEVVAYDPGTGGSVPFQKLSKRIKRKHDIQEMRERIPVETRPFDLIYKNGSLIDESYRERWDTLTEVVDGEEEELKLVDHDETGIPEEVHEIQSRALARGHEGVMMKSLDARYRPGKRVGYMVKLKPTMETLDLAIVGGEWSEGRRSGWIGSLKLACYDPENDEYREVGKMATGLTDEELEEITERLKPLIVDEEGREVEVKPEVIVEVEYEEIQESPTYGSGYALRFPRLKQFRGDKDNPDSLEKVESLYQQQD